MNTDAGTDTMDRLRDLAPDPRDLTERWSASAQADLARQITAGERDTTRLRHRPTAVVRRPRRRLVIAALVAAAAALALPAVLPSGTPGSASPAAAAELNRLAQVAADTPTDRLGPNQFVLTVTDSRQVGVGENPELGAVVLDQRSEDWTAYDGSLWSRRTTPGDASPEIYVAEPQPASGTEHFASLPTDPESLLEYLRGHVSGSSSRDEAVFLAVSDLLADPTAPAPLRSAAAVALARTDHVSLGATTRDKLGREVSRFDFIDESIRPDMVQSVFVDRATAQAVGTKTTQPGVSYASTLISAEVVDAVPVDVVRDACPVNGPIC